MATHLTRRPERQPYQGPILLLAPKCYIDRFGLERRRRGVVLGSRRRRRQKIPPIRY